MKSLRLNLWIAGGVVLVLTAGILAVAAGRGIASAGPQPPADRPNGSLAVRLTPGDGYLRGGSAQVREAQRHLRALGYRPGPADGLFGPRTEHAVRRFQRKQGLLIDGIVGPKSLAALRSLSGRERLPAAPPSPQPEGPAPPRSDLPAGSGIPGAIIIFLTVALMSVGGALITAGRRKGRGAPGGATARSVRRAALFWQRDVGNHWNVRPFTWTRPGGSAQPVDREPATGPVSATAALLDAYQRLPASESPEVLLTNARVRLLLAVGSLGSLLLGAIAVAAGASALRVACLVFFCLIGIGSAPWQGNVELRLPGRLTLTLLTGFAVLTFGSMAMITARSWHPLAAFTGVAVPCAIFHVLGLRSALGDVRFLRAAGWPWLRVGAATLALVGAGAACCLAAAVTHRHLDPGFYGFLTQIGPAWYAGLALLLIAVVTARGDEEQEMALPVLVLALVLTLTPALVYDAPSSQSAAKHVDFAIQIQRDHALTSTHDIYNNWSGFFAAAAWLCDIAGIRGPMSLATVWPALIVVFRVAALRFLFGQLLRTGSQCWIAVALTVLADSIGADYFSPQSAGFLLGLAVFGLALSQYRQALRLTLVLTAGCVLAMSHQLSPYVVGGVLVVLVVFGQVRPWWTPLLVLGPAGIWAVLHAQALEGFLSLDAIGRTSNFQPPETVGDPTLHRLPVVRETVLALLFSIAVLGAVALVGLLKNRHRRRFWAWALCPSAGLILVAINAYGQEGIFRAVLFALPWLAVLAASWLSGRSPPLVRMGALVVAAALLAANLIARFGLDAINVIRPGDVAAYRYFERQGGARPATMHYLLPLGSGDLPRGLPIRGGGHDNVTRAKIEMRVGEQPGLSPDAEMRRITAKLLRYSGEPLRTAKLYAIWSPVQSKHDWAYAVRLPGRSAALRMAFSRARYWRVVFHEDGTILYRFDPGPYAAEAR